MAFERLELEVGARIAGFGVVKPPILRGKTNMPHRFGILVSDGVRYFAFDFYDSVSEAEVQRSYVKSIDTGASTHIICLNKGPTKEARSLAAECGIRLLSQESLAAF